MLGCMPIDTPMDAIVKFGSKYNGTLVGEGSYQRLAEKLIYLSHTRLDTGFTISIAS